MWTAVRLNIGSAKRRISNPTQISKFRELIYTRQTWQFLANVFSPSLGSGHPVASRPGRIMAYMLLMSTLQVRNPVGALIQMKPHNFAGSSGQRRSLGFHTTQSTLIPVPSRALACVPFGGRQLRCRFSHSDAASLPPNLATLHRETGLLCRAPSHLS